jgi:hypothetical protein
MRLFIGIGKMVQAGLRIAILNPFPFELRPDKALVFGLLDLNLSLDTAVVITAGGSLASAARALSHFIRAERPAGPFSTPAGSSRS